MIVSNRDDLHVFAVKKILEDEFGLEVYYLSVDAAEELTICHDSASRTLIGDGTKQVDVSSFGTIWWRRFPKHQKCIRQDDPIRQDLLERDWGATIRGALESSFAGQWVSHPRATDFASLKLNQLRLAKLAGLKVPATLVTNCPIRARAFVGNLSDGAVVKTVSGTPKSAIFTAKVFESELPDDDSISLCPTIYQEAIKGDCHLRIVIFGEDIFCGMIKTSDLDWRKRVPSVITPFKIDDDLADKLITYQGLADLKMGVVDMKLDEEIGPVWLENNPQGQFLFVEGLSGIPLAKHCASFLNRMARCPK